MIETADESMMERLFAPHNPDAPARTVIFMSGSGTHARALLQFCRSHQGALKPVALVTDAPESSRARELGRDFGLPVAELDIRKFYHDRGEGSIRLDTPRRRELRQEWSDALYELLMPFSPDLGVLAGFVPLTNITGRIPCLNVHPGDLTLEDESGRRLLAGLHVLPVERAIVAGHGELRSSVILAQPYTGDGTGEMDSGPVLGVSAPMTLELEGITADELRRIRAARTPGVVPDDPLRQLAWKNLERLKYAGDHVVLPPAAADFAAGCFFAEGRRIGFSGDGSAPVPALTVEYRPDGSRRLLERTR